MDTGGVHTTPHRFQDDVTESSDMDLSPMVPAPGSGSLRETVPVHEWLLDVGQGYREHLDTLRARKEMEELLQVRDKPMISRKARNKRRSDMKVQDRLLRWGRRQQEKRSESRAREEEKRGRGVEPPYRPQLRTVELRPGEEPAPRTDYAQRLQERIGPRCSSEEWRRARDKKLAKLREEQESDLGRDVTSTPHINRKSRELAASRAGREGMPVEDYLLYADQQRRQQMYYKYEEATRASVAPQPVITRRASKLHRDGDVGERLYNQRIGATLGQSDTPGREGVWRALRAQGSAETFRPKINPPPLGARKSVPEFESLPVEAKLLRKHQQSVEQRREKQHSSERSRTDAFNMRHTSAQSDAIYQSRGLAEGQYRRIYGPADRGRGWTPEQSPVRAPRSTPTAFLNRVEEWDERRRKKDAECQRQRRDIVRREMAECTFEPFKASDVRLLRHSSVRQKGVDGSVAERSNCWMSRREARLSYQKKSRDRKEVESCTFTPMINSPPPRPSSENAFGFVEFVARMRAAREEKKMDQDRKQAAFQSGSKWTGHPTVPQEFRLGRGAGPVASLARPVEPGSSFASAIHADPMMDSPESPLSTEQGSPDRPRAALSPPRPFAFPQSEASTPTARQCRDNLSAFLAEQHQRVMQEVDAPPSWQ
eukprot:TRINITY_DN32360_c0_g1_i1.p1 TRINITY_DN32360_c0_g1~~TRINITY_DN32360_c0_g1_i1.p1  ORF type:complete len:671 (+),score=210.45 TRINITY_DN32360_c0_g1_i1:51-2015(+)